MNATPAELLQAAIAAAKAGQWLQARARLLNVVAAEPHNLLAWLWLSEAGNTLAEKIEALEKALALKPDQPAVRARLEALRRERQAVLARQAAEHETHEALFQRAVAAHQQRRNQEALDLLLQLVQQDERHEKAWLLLGEVAPQTADKIIALENALTIHPGNQPVQARLERLRGRADSPLLAGLRHEQAEDWTQAIAAYLAAINQARSKPERAEAEQRLTDVQHRQAFPQIKVISPTLTLVRQMCGPAVLFGLMALIQIGFNPLHLSPLLCVGNLWVLVGAGLIALTTLKPRHPLWLRAFWKSGGQDDPLLRVGLNLLGWVCLILPNILFLWSAYIRLQAYAATVR